MTALLEAERVSFAYGARAVLSEVDLAVAPGELVGVIGPNGGGKTTLVRLLSGVLAPRAGSVRFKGAALGASWAARRTFRHSASRARTTSPLPGLRWRASTSPGWRTGLSTGSRAASGSACCSRAQ